MLGESRDAEILAGRLEALVQELPDELVMGPVAARIQVHFAPLRAEARRAALEALDSERYVTLLDDLERLLNDPPLTAGGQAAGRRRAAEGGGAGLPAGAQADAPRAPRRRPAATSKSRCTKPARRPSAPGTPRRCCARSPAGRRGGSPGG